MTEYGIIRICKLLDEKARADEREEYEEVFLTWDERRELLELAATAAPSSKLLLKLEKV